MKKFLFFGVAFIFSTLLFAQNTNQNLLSPVGNVGVGTMNPSAKFELKGEALLDGDVKMMEELTLEKHKLLSTNPPERLLKIDKDGKIIPVDVMEIIRLHGDPIGGLAQNFWSLSGNSGVTTSNFLGSKNEAPLIFQTKGVERMRIVGNDTKVGIGTNDPKKALHIKTIHQGGVVGGGGGGQHHSHYGIRLEDFTTYGGSTTPNVSTIWDIEPFEKNLVIGKPLQPLLTLTDDNKVLINGKLEIIEQIKVGTNSLYLGAYSNTGIENNIYTENGFLNLQPNGATIGVGIPSGNSPQEKLHIVGTQAKIRVGEWDNYIRLGYNGGNSIIDNFGNGRLLLNYYSGKEVVVGNGQAVSLRVAGGSYISENLEVAGIIKACKIEVEAYDWCDYVFEENYKLMPLEELSQYLKQNKHLPEIPSEKEVINNGIDLGEMVLLQQKKIEELTLYVIELNKKLETLSKAK